MIALPKGPVAPDPDSPADSGGPAEGRLVAGPGVEARPAAASATIESGIMGCTRSLALIVQNRSAKSVLGELIRWRGLSPSPVPKHSAPSVGGSADCSSEPRASSPRSPPWNCAPRRPCNGGGWTASSACSVSAKSVRISSTARAMIPHLLWTQALPPGIYT